MKGYRQVLAILTIRTVIETLSDRDYFNVIHFNDKLGSYLTSLKKIGKTEKKQFSSWKFQHIF